MKPVYCANYKKLSLFNTLLVSICFYLTMPVANAQVYPKCSRDHPGKASRIESVVKHGDARMLLSCAGHTLKYAIERYGMQDMYSDADIDADKNGKLHEMYQTLKYIQPFYVITVFIDYGYQYFHYDARDAAGILLGIFRTHNTKGELIITTFYQKYLELNLGLKTASDLAPYFASVGLSHLDNIAPKLSTMVAAELAKAAGDRKDVFKLAQNINELIIPDVIKAKKLYGKSYTPTPDKRDTNNTRPTRESDTPVDTVAQVDKCQELLKQCEARNRELEHKIRQLESQGEANNEDPSSTPIEGGYESIYLKVTADEVEVQVKVNGKLIATYNKSATVYLDPFLKQNTLNTISFIFSNVPKYFDNVDLDGKFPGNDKWFDVYSFAPKQGKLESKFELPFAGKKN